MQKPDLTFYCELETTALKKLFESRFVMDDLKTLNARLSLGILDLSDDRAQVVKHLNRLGVKVIAWLLLPKEDGYWFNLDNYTQASQRYEDFKVWSKQHNLKWNGIGIDIEPDIQAMQDLRTKKWTMIPGFIKRFLDAGRVKRAQEAYRILVDQMHADGFFVESYHFPLIVDERKARSTVLQRVAGLVDLEVDHEVLMLYSSFLRPHGHEILWQYANEADSIGIGNTGGGVDLEGVIDIPPLTWEEFSQDLRLAHASGKPVHIFCLEGCVAQGFLARLITFDWENGVERPKGLAVRTIRGALQTLLWTLQRPWVILITILGAIGSIFLLRHKKKK
ncbi:MAG: hypothetical protein MUO40_13550 [Anaerolineaceae bacterium]|nr:hypothetical protein [Anaerolineaceae bacterium]